MTDAEATAAEERIKAAQALKAALVTQQLALTNAQLEGVLAVQVVGNSDRKMRIYLLV